MKLKLQEGWLVKTLHNSSNFDDVWEFKQSKPVYAPESYDCTLQEHVPGEVKRIMYVEVEL